MAAKSIIDVEVNDDQFKKFFELYQQFQGKLDSIPESSKAAFTAMGAIGTEAAEKLSRSMNKSVKAQSDFHVATRNANGEMKKLVAGSEKLAKNIFGIGKFLLKLSAIGVAGSIGGMFGLGALGNAAVSGQRNARGIGLNQGQIRAFDTDYGRYLPGGMLSNVAGAQSDFTKRVYLGLAAGVPYSQAASESPDVLAQKVAMRAHNWWQKTPQAMRTQQAMATQGFSQIGMGMEDVRRLGNTPISELNAASAQYKKDSSTLSIGGKQTQEWYQLTRSLKLAGQTIETVLITKLAQLAPVLGHITSALTDDISALIKGITPSDINKFANGIKSVAEYLGSPAVLENLKSFMGVIEGFLKATGHAVSAFTPSTAKDRSDYAKSDKVNKRHSDFWFKSVLPLKLYPSLKNNAEKEAFLTAVEQKYKLPKGVADSVWAQESGRGKNVGPSSAGAIGNFQLMPATAAAYHVNPNKFRESAMGFGQIMSENMARYHGNLKQALAAYNAGSGTVDKAIKAAGKNGDWQSEMSKYQSPKNYRETSNYVQQTMARIDRANNVKTPTVNVTITNKTGADIYSSTNAAAR